MLVRDFAYDVVDSEDAKQSADAVRRLFRIFLLKSQIRYQIPGLGIPSLLRVVVDKGFAGEPNLKALDRLKVHETLIPQLKTSKRGERVKEAKRLVCRRTYWMKKRKRIESGFGHTKENKGLIRLLLRGVWGAEIEMILDAIGFNLEKIAAKFEDIQKQKIKQSLALASQLGF